MPPTSEGNKDICEKLPTRKRFPHFTAYECLKACFVDMRVAMLSTNILNHISHYIKQNVRQARHSDLLVNRSNLAKEQPKTEPIFVNSRGYFIRASLKTDGFFQRVFFFAEWCAERVVRIHECIWYHHA